MWLFLSCHNALCLFKNSQNKQFRVVAASVMPQRVVVVYSAQWAFSIFERNIHVLNNTKFVYMCVESELGL